MPSYPTYSIALLPSGKTFAVGGETLLLDAALEEGISVPFSCRRGECGSCRARVVSGQHRVKPTATENVGIPYPLAEDELLLCQSHACADMAIEIPGWSESDVPLPRFETEIIGKHMAAPDVIRLTLRPLNAGPLPVRAGQYMKLFLEDGTSRCFSIANIPAAQDGLLEFHIRKVEGGRFSQCLLDSLCIGSIVYAEGPFGACTWQSGVGVTLVLFATGTGYAGIKPIMLTALAENNAMPVTLYWGGRRQADFYDKAFLDDLAAQIPTFRWIPVESGAMPPDTTQTERVQDIAMRDQHPWSEAQVYACGNPNMVRDLRKRLRSAGLPTHNFFAEAFVPSGASLASLVVPVLHPVWERVGAKYSLDGMLLAREQSMRAVAQIGAMLRPGMTTTDAIEMANAHLRSMGVSHTWHPTYIRFGDDTVKTPRQRIHRQRTLRTSDIAVVDIGPVWDGYEGDFGDTFVFGNQEVHHQCAEAARTVFAATQKAWHDGLTGRALYAHAERVAAGIGWLLERDLAGHRVSDFPHALYGRSRLAELEIVPGDAVWVLEIQLRHPVEPVGAFYEDILVKALSIP